MLDVPGWHELALWWPERRVLVVAELIGTNRVYRLGRGGGDPPHAARAGALRGYPPEHLLVGHGRGVHGPAAARALEDAYARSRSDLPKLALGFPRWPRGAPRCADSQPGRVGARHPRFALRVGTRWQQSRRHVHLAPAAVAGGGLLSSGAVERLVARDALGYGGPARRPTDRCGGSRPARRGGARAAGGLQLRDVQPHRLRDVGRQPDAARARRHGRVRGRRHGRGRGTVRPPPGAARAQQRGPQPGRHVGGLLGDRSKAYDPTAFGGTTTLVYDEHRRRAGAGLRQPQRHDGELRRRHLLPPPLLAHRRGDRRRARTPIPPRVREASRLPVPDAGRPRPERARGRRADRRRRPVLARGGGRRPAHRHRLRDRGPGLRRRRRLLPLHPGRPRRPDGGRRARHARDRRTAAGRPARGPHARRGRCRCSG